MGKKQPVKRHCIPAYDKTELREGLLEHMKKEGVNSAFELGPYMSLSRSRAASAAGLIGMQCLLQVLLRVAPHAEIHIAALKDCFLAVAVSYPAVTGGTMGARHWAGWMTERIMTALNHVRRIKNSSKKYKECTRLISAADRETLDGILAMVASGSGDGSKSSGSKSVATPASKKRALKAELSHASDVTLDSQGWPALLSNLDDVELLSAKSEPGKPADDSPAKSKGKPKAGAQASAKGKGKAKAKAKAKAKGKAKGETKRVRLEFKVWQGMSVAAKAKARPQGCSKCRGKVGCTPSCLKK